MRKTRSTAACLALTSAVCSAADFPAADISNGTIHARVFLPDAARGYYRGTRFDWAGVLADLEYAGHNYYPQWFERVDPTVRDFVYAGPEIVASTCTGIAGPAEEFVANGSALGFPEAKPGGTFIKIGVGVLRRPDDRPYDSFRLYEIVDGGKWTVTRRSSTVTFQQEVSDRVPGYGYRYHKTVSLTAGQPQLVLDHRLRNTGKRTISTSVYNHNFLYLDRQPPGPGCTISVPFPIRLVLLC